MCTFQSKRLSRANIYFCTSYRQTDHLSEANKTQSAYGTEIQLSTSAGIDIELAPNQLSLPSTNCTPRPRTPEGCNILPPTHEQVMLYSKAGSRKNTKTARKIVKQVAPKTHKWGSNLVTTSLLVH